MQSLGLNKLLKIADLFAGEGKVRQAETILTTAKTYFGHDFRPHFNLGLIQVKCGRVNESLSEFESALQITTEIDEIYVAYSGALIKAWNPLKAVEIALKGLDVHRHSIGCVYNANVALRQLGHCETAIKLSWQIFHDRFIPPSSEKAAIESSSFLPFAVVFVKWGIKYSSNYVNNLHRALLRNISLNRHSSVQFFCFTDDSSGISSSIICKSFPACSQSWESWWLKAVPFSDVDAEKYIYIDLDTVITSSVDWLFAAFDEIEQKSLNAPQLITLDTSTMANEGVPS